MIPVIRTEALGKVFGQTVALQDLDLQVNPGEVFGLIGPNGAGKTTTMRLLLDVIRPTSGTVRVFGQAPRSGGPALRARLAFLPGELRLASRATGRELLAFYARLHDSVAASRYEALAERLRLNLAARVSTLSKGNKQKLGLIQAFMRRADLLILDEPTSGLDPLMQREFLTLVRESQAGGSTVLLSSHVLSEVQQVAERVAILRRGRLATLESVAALRAAAPRRVRVSASPQHLQQVQAALSALPGASAVTVLTPRGAGAGGDLEARYTGAPGPLLRLLASVPVTDLVLAEPDLEEAVMALYDDAADSRKVGGGEANE